MSKKSVDIRFLIQGCLKENRQSQRQLYEQFYSYALSITLRYSKNREDAVELMNDGFLKVFKHLHKYNSDLPFTAWIRRILINTCIDDLRAKKKDLKLVELDYAKHVTDNETPMPKLSPDEDVLPILQQLSPTCRMAFNLYVMEGYKHREIAKMLGISEGTSKSNLARAKQHLRQLLTKPLSE